jgi:hypothetical protein
MAMGSIGLFVGSIVFLAWLSQGIEPVPGPARGDVSPVHNSKDKTE